MHMAQHTNIGRSPGTYTWRCPCGHRCCWACSPVSTFTPTPLLGTAPPLTCVLPSSFPSVVCWTQYHTLQFADKKVRLPELFCWQKSLMWKPWWAYTFPGYALTLVCAHGPLPPSLRLTNFCSTLDTRGIGLTLGSARRTGHLLGGQYC